LLAKPQFSVVHVHKHVIYMQTVRASNAPWISNATIALIRQLTRLGLFLRLMTGVDLFWEKSTAGWLPVPDLFWEKSTPAHALRHGNIAAFT
jgi:hypothetical protein